MRQGKDRYVHGALQEHPESAVIELKVGAEKLYAQRPKWIKIIPLGPVSQASGEFYSHGKQVQCP